MLQIVGKTTDGLMVVSGVFKLEDTCGIPLSMVLNKLKQSQMVPDWYDFYAEARKSGWGHKTVERKILEAVEEVYGLGSLEHFKDVLKRIGQ